MVPEFVNGQMTRRDIVESNIEEFNSKCAAKPEEQKSILKDKRRKGKNRVSTTRIAGIRGIGFFERGAGSFFFY